MADELPIPTEADINPHDSLDERWAVKHFLGKDLQQAEEMFPDEIYWEDLMWMGPRAFCYYVRAAFAYLNSPAARGDATGVFSFCGTLEFRVEHDWEEIGAVHEVIRNGIAMILNRFRDGHFDPDEYKGLEERYRVLLDRCGQ